MGVVEDIADELARETMELMEQLGDDEFFKEVAHEIGALSQTSEEAFTTAIRVRLAERRAKRFLKETAAKIAKSKA